MPKLQQYPDGKLCIGPGFKVLEDNGEACGCEPPEPARCGLVANSQCTIGETGSPSAMADTYKVTLSGVSLCSGVTGDSPDRDYYVLVYDYGLGVGVGGELDTLDEVTVGATTLNPILTFGVSKTPLFGTPSGNPYLSANLGALGIGTILQTPVDYEVPNFCAFDPQGPFPNDLSIGDCAGSGGYGGTITFEACPPCAVDCEASPCATVEGDGSLPFDPSGEYVANSTVSGVWTLDRNNQVSGLRVGESPGAGGGPAGCVWSWSYTPDEPIDVGPYTVSLLTVYVWYDGRHWRGILTRSGSGEETAVALSLVPGSVTCTGGELAGDLVLGDGITVTLGPCPGDCDEVDANYLSQDVAWFNGGASYAAGDYEIEYLYGAITYDQINQGYRVNAISGGYYYAIVGDDETDIAEAPPQGEYAEYPNEAAHTADHQGSTVTFTHSGGKIGIRLHDDNTTDNALDAAHRPPRFRLCAVPA